MAYEGMADRRKIHSRIIANSINNESDFNHTAVVARNQKLLCYLGLGHGLPYFVTDASQLDAGSEVDVTEEWLSTAHPSQHSPDWSAEDGQPLPRLPDICYPVDMASHRPSYRPPPILLPLASNQLGQEYEQISRSSLKYPLLNTVMHFLETHIPPRLVCDLLELYFTRAFLTQMRPVCQNIQCYILRKASFLADEFRPTSVPLLTSMLSVAAVDDGAFSLFTSPSHQRSICQFLKPDENFTERFRQWLDR